MKKVLAVTGIRSEYDILYPVLKELKKHPEFELKVVVTGAHLSDWHGLTLKKIQEDGFEIADKLDTLLMTNRKTQRSKGVGLLIAALTQTVEREKPDFLLFVGDREESIATCVVGNYMDILVAHIGGGDPVYGNADDPIRMACSKLAHIHFATAQDYANNILKMGEEEFRVVNTGNPALNNIIETKFLSRRELSDFLSINVEDANYIVVLKHPLSSEVDDAYHQMKTTMRALARFAKEENYKVIGIYPNTDPGAYDIIQAIDEQCDENIKFYKNLPRDIFVNLMRGASCLVGNSSMGILEAPTYKLPVVNVGSRQQGRLNAGNVKFVPYDDKQIFEAIKQACMDESYRSLISSIESPYGDGSAHKKIVEFLDSIDLDDDKWLIKRRLI